MGTELIVLLLIALAIYPLAAPWKNSFIFGWFVIWFGLWGLLFLFSNYESMHLTKGILSVSNVLGVFISVFALSSLARLVFRNLINWFVRNSDRESSSSKSGGVKP